MKYLEWAILIILFVGLFMLSRQVDFIQDLSPLTLSQRGVIVGGIVLIGFAAITAHELGHLLVGLMQGFRFELFVVGFLGVKREEDFIKWYFNKNMGLFGGVAATSPVEDDPTNAKKFARILLAGPVASILFAILCVILAFTFWNIPGLILFTGGIISLTLFLVTTIPSKTGVFFTDRKRYQRLVTPGKDQDVELAMLSILGKTSKDKSYRNIDSKDMEVLIADDLPFIRFYGLFTKVCYQLEHNGQATEEVLAAYHTAANGLSKNLVAAFDSELEGHKKKIIQSANDL